MTRFGYSGDLISLPMIHALLQNQIEHPFQMIRLKEEDILKKLLNGTLDMGILSPYFYARKQGSIRIVRQFPVINRQPIASILLFFQGNLKTIDRVYWKKNLHAQYEYFLGKLILEEFLGVESDWEIIEQEGEIEDILPEHPVVLLTGEDAFRASDSLEGMIDLTEEWLLKTDLPLVQRLVVVKETFKEKGELEKLQLSMQLGLRRLKDASENYAKSHRRNWDIYFDVLQKVEYGMDSPEVWDSLREVLQYLFFKGEADYYPEMEFLE